jgi:hypothetical protein
LSASAVKPLCPHQTLKERQAGEKSKVGTSGAAQGIDIVTDVGWQAKRQFWLATPSRLGAAALDPAPAVRDPLDRSPQGHHTIGDFAGEFDVL